MLCSIRCISVLLTSNGESVYLFLNLWLSIWMNHAVKQAAILVSSAPAYAGPHCHSGSELLVDTSQGMPWPQWQLTTQQERWGRLSSRAGA